MTVSGNVLGYLQLNETDMASWIVKRGEHGERMVVRDTSRYIHIAVVPEESCYDDLKAIILELLTLHNNWRAAGDGATRPDTSIGCKLAVFVKVHRAQLHGQGGVPPRWTVKDLEDRMPGHWGVPGVIAGRAYSNVGIEMFP